jgi:hypothetical protein
MSPDPELDKYREELYKEQQQLAYDRSNKHPMGNNRIGILIGGPFDGKAEIVQKNQLDIIIPVVNRMSMVLYDPTEIDPFASGTKLIRYYRILIAGLPEDTRTIFYLYQEGII